MGAIPIAVIVVITLALVLGLGLLIFTLMRRSQEVVPRIADEDAAHRDRIVAVDDEGRPVTESEAGDQFRLVTLPALVRMKLVGFRDKDRTHLRDLIELGLLNASWCERLPQALAARLQVLLENPE